MRFVDAHLHTDMIEDVQLQKLVMMGMEAAVIPSPHMFVGTHDADTVLLLWERFLTMEATTAKTLGYEAFTSISVPFFGVNHADAEKCPSACRSSSPTTASSPWARSASIAAPSSKSGCSASTCGWPRSTTCR